MYKILAKTSLIGQNLIYVPSCHSTNDICADFLKKNDVTDGTIVITDDQTSGRGQANNLWESKAGENLTLSLIADTSFLDIQSQFYLNIVACLSVSQVIDNFLGPSTKVKWPNDIYIGSKKAGGILIQNTIQGKRIESTIMGFGINVNQSYFSNSNSNAISMNMITGRSFHLNEVLNQLVEQLEIYFRMLKKSQIAKLKDIYLTKLYWKGENHWFDDGQKFEGIIDGIDSMGRLLIKTDGIVKQFDHRQVRFLE